MSRPSFEETFLAMARALSLRSSCARLQVGCVITTADHARVLSCGYNGDAPGRDALCDPSKVGACCDGGPLHAEENAIIACSAAHDVPKNVYVTHFPCAMCCKRIVRLGGVKRVVYAQEYRSREGEKILTAAGIEPALMCKGFLFATVVEETVREIFRKGYEGVNEIVFPGGEEQWQKFREAKTADADALNQGVKPLPLKAVTDAQAETRARIVSWLRLSLTPLTAERFALIDGIEKGLYLMPLASGVSCPGGRDLEALGAAVETYRNAPASEVPHAKQRIVDAALRYVFALKV